jgi:glutamine synthetase
MGQTAVEIVEGWRARGIRWVRFEVPDVHGTSRSKMVPIDHAAGFAESGLNMYGGAGVLDTASHVVGGTLYNEETGYADMRIVPDPATAGLVPWCEVPTARFICDAYGSTARCSRRCHAACSSGSSSAAARTGSSR